ncbi:Sodium- and chloride-dependent betaine transporter-like [Oopsacas minuta]|uniref:Sodium- and chloride-dependent betaine transporter-like n=1 Tax=Oopsacas minuta TaxID=111878 RepID=A0AAV7K305_9METZ|nr:Sodium- and chloride-dependent betaine transporter-like [Oopsacas minuta]
MDPEKPENISPNHDDIRSHLITSSLSPHHQYNDKSNTLSVSMRSKGGIKSNVSDESYENSYRYLKSGQLTARPKKERWSSRAEYILSLVGYAVGFGNVWRFSYYVQLNGGGAFLIPYFLMLFILGVPAFYLEVHIGKISQVGPLNAMHRLVPPFCGVGLAAIVTMIYITFNYSLLIAYVLFYLFSSFQNPPAWSSLAYCGNISRINDSLLRQACNKSAPTLFYYSSVAGVTSTIEDTTGFSWKLMLCIIGAWLLIFLCTFKGIKSFGKIAYVTTIFPYIVLTVLLIRGATFEGAGEGLKALFYPNLKLLLNFKVWLQAGSQIFFSLSLGTGGNIVLASHLDQKTNVFPSVIFVSLVNSGTSIFSGIVVFMILGHNAHLRGESVQDIVAGPGLVFIAVASALLDTPPAPLWSVLFFLMMLSLGLSSQFPSIQSLTEAARSLPYMSKVHETIISFIICSIFTVCSVIFVLGNGQYIFGLIDEFAASYSLFVVIFFEFIGVAWFFGVNKILWYQTGEIIVTAATSRLARIRSNKWFKGFTLYFWSISWIIVAPLVMIVIFSGSLIYQLTGRPKYTAFQNYTQVQVHYPIWSLAVIVFIILSTIIPVPLGMLYEYKELWHMIKNSLFSVRRRIMRISYKLGLTQTQDYAVDDTMDHIVHYSANEDSVSLVKNKEH